MSGWEIKLTDNSTINDKILLMGEGVEEEFQEQEQEMKRQVHKDKTQFWPHSNVDKPVNELPDSLLVN